MEFNQKQVKIGKPPHYLCVDSKSNTVFVSCNGSSEILIINGNTLELIHSIYVPQPQHLAVNTVTNKLYVINNQHDKFFKKDEGDVISVINLKSFEIIETLSQEKGFGNLAINSNTNKIITFSKESDEELLIFNGENHKIDASKKLEGTLVHGTGSVAVNNDSGKIYCLQSEPVIVSEKVVLHIVDEKFNIITHRPDTKFRYCGLVDWTEVNSKGDVFFVTGDDTPGPEGGYVLPFREIYKFDGTTKSFTAKKTDLRQIEHMAYNPNNSKIYVAETNSDSIIILDENLSEISRNVLPPLKKQKTLWRDPAYVRLACNLETNQVFFTSQDMENRKEYCLYFFNS